MCPFLMAKFLSLESRARVSGTIDGKTLSAHQLHTCSLCPSSCDPLVVSATSCSHGPATNNGFRWHFSGLTGCSFEYCPAVNRTTSVWTQPRQPSSSLSWTMHRDALRYSPGWVSCFGFPTSTVDPMWYLGGIRSILWLLRCWGSMGILGGRGEQLPDSAGHQPA